MVSNNVRGIRSLATRTAAALLASVGVVACAQLVEAPVFGQGEFTNCNAEDGIQICIDRSEYHALDPVVFTISNGQTRDVFEDVCGGEIEGRASPQDPWGNFSSGTVRMCNGWVSNHQDVLETMVPLPRGELVTDTLVLSYWADPGQWHLLINVVGADGLSIRDHPFGSPVFQVVE
ncbi:MAG: hypothetical protein LJF06_04730 [Gemmatimonadetes bacterium]|jgi:hypothetical protein|nr:hypothetical protein [Gemmatimonadota bacterium]